MTEWQGWLATCWTNRGEVTKLTTCLLRNTLVHVLYSYYPLYPPHEDVGMDISRALQHCCLQVKPDVLFLPSELRPFTKVPQ